MFWNIVCFIAGASVATAVIGVLLLCKAVIVVEAEPNLKGETE